MAHTEEEESRLVLERNPLEWSVSDVVNFIMSTDCASLANIFQEQVHTHTHTRLYCPTNMCHVHVPHVYAHFVLRSVDEVCVTLKTQGFVQVDPHTHLEGRVFCKDTHCPDVLLFPRQARELRDKTTLLLDRTLIIQVTHSYYTHTLVSCI